MVNVFCKKQAKHEALSPTADGLSSHIKIANACFGKMHFMPNGWGI